MKPFCTVFFLFLACIEAAAQFVAPQTMSGANIQRHPYGYVTTFPGPPPGIEGTSYLYDNYNYGTVMLTDDKIIEDIQMKIDLQNKLIEISHNGQVKVLDFARVKAVDLKLLNGRVEHFVNAKTLKFSAAPLDGLYSFVKDGKYNLLLHTRVEKIPPQYNAALDIGSKDFRIVQKKYYFIMKDGLAVPVDKSKKKFHEDLEEAFGGDFDNALDGVKVAKESSLVDLVFTLNSSAL
jgi:hypothetical protein